VPVVALSGRAELVEVEKGLAAGFTDYIAKSDREGLGLSLRRALQPRHAPAAITAPITG